MTTGSQGGCALLAVANTGPGIAPAEVGRLFEPFQRLGAERTGRDGLGLGLSIVRAIADAHQARLRARAAAAGGLDIQVRFPLCPSGWLAAGSGAPPWPGVTALQPPPA